MRISNLASKVARGLPVVAVALALAGPASAKPPVELENDPFPACVADDPAELNVLRSSCDVLAFLLEYQFGFVRPCQARDSADCNACQPDETAWVCFGIEGK